MQKLRTPLFLGALLALSAGAVQARGDLSWSLGVATPGAVISVGQGPAVMLPAPVLVPAPALAVPVVYLPGVPLLQVEARRDKSHGRGWQRKHERHAQGRPAYWRYEAAPASVVVHAAPTWVR